MKIYDEKSLRNFEFWSGATDTASAFTWKELDIIESELERLYPDGLSATELNDLFWFEDDYIAKMAGYEDMEEVLKSNAVKAEYEGLKALFTDDEMELLSGIC